MSSVRSLRRILVPALPVGSLAPIEVRAQAISAQDWNAPVSLELRDGRRLEGRVRGVIGGPESDTPYALRYEAWRTEHGAASAPAIGEAVDVELKSGDTISATFH